MSEITNEFMVCSCMSEEHVVHFMYADWDDGDNDLPAQASLAECRPLVGAGWLLTRAAMSN